MPSKILHSLMLGWVIYHKDDCEEKLSKGDFVISLKNGANAMFSDQYVVPGEIFQITEMHSNECSVTNSMPIRSGGSRTKRQFMFLTDIMAL